MILTAQLFDTFDRCERRLAYECTLEPTTITPTGLLYAAIEASMTAADPGRGSKDAISERMQWMDLNAGDLSPLSAVRHVDAMAEVIGLALREKFGRAKRLDPVTIGEHEWHSNLFECRGILHRIILTSYMDDDSLRSFAHAWQTIGELAALERAISLTVVIIGAQRGGRRHSPWAKGFKHPVQRNIRFAPRKKDSGFTANWKTEWREQTDISAQTWLDQMKSDEVLEELIVSRRVQYRADDERMIQAKRDMLILADQMGYASVDAPMRRSSCDELGRGPCPWQPLDYSATVLTPDDLPHLYRRRETPLVEIEVGTSANHSGARKP